MKIIFNHTIKNWYMPIYDELIREHEVLLPENFNGPTKMDRLVNLNALDKIGKDNNGIDLIFDFCGIVLELIKTLTRIKIINQKYNLTKNIPFLKFNKNIKAFLDFFEDFLRKFLKSPQAQKFH